MAPSVAIAAAGGTDDGGIGTSFDLISGAIAEAEAGDGAIVLYDLGSALLTAETALEFCDPEQAARIIVVDARWWRGPSRPPSPRRAGPTSTRRRPPPGLPRSSHGSAPHPATPAAGAEPGTGPERRSR